MLTWLKRINDALAGWPDAALTALLLAYGILNIVAALFFPRIVKAALSIYALF